MLHCNRRIGARERRQLIPHVRFQVPFLGPESQLKSGFACAGLLCSVLNDLAEAKRRWTEKSFGYSRTSRESNHHWECQRHKTAATLTAPRGRLSIGVSAERCITVSAAGTEGRHIRCRDSCQISQSEGWILRCDF